MPEQTTDAEWEWMTVNEVATTLRVSKMTIYRLVASGEMASVVIGRSVRIRRQTYLDFIADRENGA